VKIPLRGIWCGPLAVPGSFLGANACVICRPQPLARVAFSAAGGAPLAPHRQRNKEKFHCVEFGTARLRCPAASLARTPASSADRSAINHFTSSATGGVK